ncbi:glycosyltransferase [Lactiplantibacillus plantarum]|uniref:Glycosyltransferase n=1 Tax=Lactiplantibacillus plantarum TaxID=1590 RepID=A0AAW3RH00_LACPN|nr:glycosyltransferase [Lactiplantibacillus plantarum]
MEISKRLLVMFPNLKIGIVGDGSLKERLQSLIRELPQISLLGFQSNPYQYMHVPRLYYRLQSQTRLV